MLCVSRFFVSKAEIRAGLSADMDTSGPQYARSRAAIWNGIAGRGGARRIHMLGVRIVSYLHVGMLFFVF